MTSILCIPCGYTVTLWSAGALTIAKSGLPSRGGVLLFVLGAVVGFLLLALVGRAHLTVEIPMRIPAVALGEELARRAAMAVDNSRLYRDAERGRQHAEELARLARRLTESLDAGAVSERIVESVLRLFGAKSAVLRRLQPDGSLQCLAVAGRRLAWIIRER